MKLSDTTLAVENSPVQAWKMVEESLAVFKDDVNLRIQRGDERGPFMEPWATGFADPNASSHYFHVYYESTLTHILLLVNVDGGRCWLPMPDPAGAGKTPLLLEFKVAEIFTSPIGRVAEYLNRAGLTPP